MTATRGVRHYLTPRKCEGDPVNPRDEVRRESSTARQESELARHRAQAMNYVRLPKRKLPAMLWIAHQLGAVVRKSGVTC